MWVFFSFFKKIITLIVIVIIVALVIVLLLLLLSVQLKPALSQRDVMQSRTYWKALSFGRGNIKAFTMPYSFIVLSQMHIHLIFTIILFSWYFYHHHHQHHHSNFRYKKHFPWINTTNNLQGKDLNACALSTLSITSLKEIRHIMRLLLLETSTIYM